MTACRSPREAELQPVAQPDVANSTMSLAVVYKVNAEYSDLVPVAVSPQTKRIVSFPAPTDVTPATAPIPLKDGYYLDCQGIGVNSKFLSWTRTEYAGFEHTPSLADIEAHIMSGSGVNVVVRLPITLNEARRDTALVNRYVDSGFEGCAYLKGAPIKFDPSKIPTFNMQ